ncbi:MAG TPA: adenylate/guanylate cyclase domain-containing protein [Actinomycetota bacterium]|nr:adenylate/guanylate cyclase domain-containing protein [Actinomycetota bacterium]
MRELPTGTVTFLFTDIEGSTRLLEELGEGFRVLQDDHAAIVRAAIAHGDGVEVRTEGDSFFAVFQTPGGAVRAAVHAQRALAGHDWPSGRALRVRMGMHIGEGVLGGGDYLGLDVNRAARIAAVGWGGQVVISDAVRGMVERDLPEGVAVRSLGMHRLKDLALPEQLFDLVIAGLPSEFPPIRSLEAPIDLPEQRTSFVGRRAEILKARELLAANRLLTLIGPGGTGKTRLAVHLAALVAPEFPDGVSFVDLSQVAESGLVISTVAASLGLREDGWERPVKEVLENHLLQRHLLLVLDNFEQVLDAADDVTRLLAVSRRSKIIVTSRAALHLLGEQTLSVAPLPLPDTGSPAMLDALSRNEAVTLFVDRATAVAPEFVLTEENVADVAAICARLDGLPLAIELAASRVALLGPKAMLQLMEHRLPLLIRGPQDLPARQRTLRGAIAWSYELLSEPERLVFRRLTTLAGGSTLEAAAAVCDPDGDAGLDMLEALATLVDVSLVRAVTGEADARFDMLQTVREFGAERLDAEDDRMATQRRHACWFLELTEEAERHFRGPEIVLWLHALETEHDNLRAALGWALANDEGDIALRMAGSMWRLWHLGGYLSQGRHYASAALALPSASDRTLPRARALTALGGIAYWQNDVLTVHGAYEEALAIFSELGDDEGIADGTYNLAFAFGLEQDRDTASTLFERSWTLFEQLGDRRGEADAMWALSLIARLEGDLHRALELSQGSVSRHRALGDWFGIADSLHELGRAALELGDIDTARSSILEVLETVASFGYRTGAAISLDNLAAAESRRGLHARAVRLRGASQALKDASGGRPPPEFVDQRDPRLDARSTMSDEVIDAEWNEGMAMSLEEAVAYALEEPVTVERDT